MTTTKKTKLTGPTKKTKLTVPMKKALLEDAFSTLYDKDLRKAMQMTKTAAEYQIETFLKGEQLVPQMARDLVSAYNVKLITFQRVHLPSYVEFVDRTGSKAITRRAFAPHDETLGINNGYVGYKHCNWEIQLSKPVTLPLIGKYYNRLCEGSSYRDESGNQFPPRLSINWGNEPHILAIFNTNSLIHGQIIAAYEATYRYETDAIALVENFQLLLKAAKNVEMVQDFYPRAKAICAPLIATPDLPAFINTALLDRMKGMEFDPVKLAA